MKQKDIFLILIPSFIMVVLWVIFSIYHNLVSSTISKPLSVQIQPIEPDFNRSVIKEIKERKKVDPIYESLIQNSNTQLTQEASDSGDLFQSDQGEEESSPSGQIEEEL
ncbi:MAG: hypothetical protein HYV38_01155 [Candidatus Levybacteria bacterium]|nr:hypothetical protein [Candidatus Levybacteria bacterium]